MTMNIKPEANSVKKGSEKPYLTVSFIAGPPFWGKESRLRVCGALVSVEEGPSYQIPLGKMVATRVIKKGREDSEIYTLKERSYLIESLLVTILPPASKEKPNPKPETHKACHINVRRYQSLLADCAVMGCRKLAFEHVQEENGKAFDGVLKAFRLSMTEVAEAYGMAVCDNAISQGVERGSTLRMARKKAHFTL